MRPSSIPLKARNPYSRPSLIFPQPYALFPKCLVEAECPTATSPGLRGVELFFKVYGKTSRQHALSSWKRLPEDQKAVFLNPPEKVDAHYERICRSYREAGQNADDNNPFWNVHLYPWEIVKDKLRHRPPFASDVYDILIQEAMALGPAAIRPGNLYESEIEFHTDHKNSALQVSYRDLPSEQKEKFEAQSRRKMDFFKRRREFNTARKVPLTSFNIFYEHHEREFLHLTQAERNKAVSKLWEKEKVHHNIAATPTTASDFREKSLEIKLAIVMDYIFDYNTVEHFNGDWRRWRQRVSDGLHYLDKVMFPFVVKRTKGEVFLVRELPKLYEDLWNTGHHN